MITTDWYEPVINGVVTSVVNLKRELEEQGHEVRILTLSNQGWAYREGPVYYMRSRDAGRIYPGARAVCLPGCGFIRELEEWHPDLIHSQCEFSSFLPAERMAGRLSVPLVHTYHTVYEDYTHYFAGGRAWGRQAAAVFSRFVLDRTDRVIAPTRKTAALLERYGVRVPVDVVPTGICAEKFLPADWQQAAGQRRDIRARFHIPEDCMLFLTLGRLAREKNVEELITLFSGLKRRDAMLLIVGDGPARRELEALAESLGEGRIRFAGMVKPEETPAFYHAADLFVCASRSETQGITYLEALCSGLPVLCRKDPCVEGIVKNGENGWQYETEEEFARFAEDFGEDRILINLLSSQAVRTGREYDAARFGQRVLQVYGQALAQKGEACRQRRPA